MMKFTAKLLPILTVSLLSSAVSFSQTPSNDVPTLTTGAPSSGDTPENFISDELVAIVGNAPIMLSEVERFKTMIIESRRQTGVSSLQTPLEEAIEALLVQKLLIQQGLADSLDQDMNKSSIASQVEEQVADFIEHLGSAKELERLYGKALFQIKRDLEEELLDNQIAKEMDRVIKKRVKVSNNDVRDFFQTLNTDSLPMVPVQYVYSQIVKSPPQTETRKMAIRERLLGFRKRILAGEKLAVLARLYSQDAGTKANGGEDGPRPIYELVAPFANALETLEPGNVSEVVETEYGYHIIELISREGDLVHYRHLLLKPEFDPEEVTAVTHELDSLREAVESGRMTFATAALRHSDDKVSRNNGGRVYNVRAYTQSGGDISKASTLFMADELAVLDVNDYLHLSIMKVGEISQAYETTDEKGNMIYKMITLESIVPPHHASLEYDYNIIESVTRLRMENEALGEWVNETVGKFYVFLAPEYASLRYETPLWVAQSAKFVADPIENHLPEGYWEGAVNSFSVIGDIASREVETGVGRKIADELINQEQERLDSESGESGRPEGGRPEGGRPERGGRPE